MRRHKICLISKPGRPVSWSLQPQADPPPVPLQNEPSCTSYSHSGFQRKEHCLGGSDCPQVCPGSSLRPLLLLRDWRKTSLPIASWFLTSCNNTWMRGIHSHTLYCVHTEGKMSVTQHWFPYVGWYIVVEGTAWESFRSRFEYKLYFLLAVWYQIGYLLFLNLSFSHL